MNNFQVTYILLFAMKRSIYLLAMMGTVAAAIYLTTESARASDQQAQRFFQGTDTTGRDGKALYIANCASCHHPSRYAVGPPFYEFLKGREPGFLYRFLALRSSLESDSLIRSRVEQFGMRCIIFPDVTPAQAVLLENYFQSE